MTNEMKPIFFFFFPLLIAAASAADISPGSTLSAADPTSRWNSPNNTFSLSFVPDPSGALIAAVAYSNDRPIWQAGASANSSAVLRLHPSGDLQLLPSPTSSTPLWSSGTANLGVSAASLEESGNFVLKNSSGAAVWSTFDHPTDTIVPTQKFHPGQTLSSGLYSFRIQHNGNLTLLWNNTIIYYNSGLNSTSNSNISNPFLEIQAAGFVALSDPALSTPRFFAYSSDYGDEGNILRSLKLDSDGNLRIYSISRGGSSLSIRWVWAAVSNQCQVYGYCGNMGICSYFGSNPTCGCPYPGFGLIDPKDSRKGCKRTIELRDCLGRESMLELDQLLFSSEAYYVSYRGIKACRDSCLTWPSCIASTALADGSGECHFQLDDFISGYYLPTSPSTSYVKVCQDDPPPTASTSNGKTKGWKSNVWLVVRVVFATVIGLVAFEAGLWWCWCFRRSSKVRALSAEYELLEYASGAPVQFSYRELHTSTKGFKEKLGAGGFGAVYKGVLANRTKVAVKRLERIEQGEKQFRMEVATISSTHHLNLVRLIGFCSEGKHRLLVYEIMKNSSLDNCLFSSEERSQKLLNWECRFGIALGTARGITYLHEECRDCIVHCDIKPENILLDENYRAKVSDFGLAKLVNPKDHNRYSTSMRGTRGYLAPEWLANLPITSKSDVYSYGMVLLEIVSGRRNFEVSNETSHKKFSSWAYEEFEKGNYEAIVDRRLRGCNEEINMEQVKRAIQVSFWCIQEQPSQRPMMGKVVQMLEGILVIDRPPAPKATREGSVGGIDGTTSGDSVFSTSDGSKQTSGVSSPDSR